MKPWVKTGLFFAVWMFVFMTFVAPYIFVWIGLEDYNYGKTQPITKIIISAVIYTIGGLIIGYMNRNKYKKPKKQIDA